MNNKTVSKIDNIDSQFVLDGNKFPELKKEFDEYDKIRNIYKFFHSTLTRLTKDVKKKCLEKINGEIGKTQEFGIFNYKIDFKNTTSNFKAKNLLSNLNINRGIIEKEIPIESIGSPSLDGRIGFIRSHQMANLEKKSNEKFKKLIDFISSAPKDEAISIVWSMDKSISSILEDKKKKIKSHMNELIEDGKLPLNNESLRYQIMFDNNICYKKSSRNYFSVSKMMNEIDRIYSFEKDRPNIVDENNLSKDKYDIISVIKRDNIDNINSPTQLKKILDNNSIDISKSKELKDLLKDNSIVYVVKYKDEYAKILDNNKQGLINNINDFKKKEALLNSIIDVSKDVILNEASDNDKDLINITLRNLSSSKNEEDVTFDKEYMAPNISKDDFIKDFESKDLINYINDTYLKYIKISEQKTPLEYCLDYVSRDIVSENLSPVNIRSKKDYRAKLRSNMETNSLEYIENIIKNYPKKGITDSEYIEGRIFKELIGEDETLEIFSDKNNEFDIDTLLSLYENDNNLSSIETKDYVDLKEFELNGGNFIGYMKYLKLNCFNPEQVSYSHKIYEGFIEEKSLKEDIKKINKIESGLKM